MLDADIGTHKMSKISFIFPIDFISNKFNDTIYDALAFRLENRIWPNEIGEFDPACNWRLIAPYLPYQTIIYICVRNRQHFINFIYVIWEHFS